MTQFGVQSTGFVPMRYADAVQALQTDFQKSFGNNLNFDPRSNIGQIINIFAERIALLYELGEAAYNAGFPQGATGVQVDNLLAFNGLQRLGATYTTTENTPVVQSNGITLFGLVCFGTPGTVIPKGALVADTQTPAHVFVLDASVTIGAAVNAQQTLVLSNTPTSGAYTLVLTTPTGVALATPSIPFDALLTQTQLTWPVAPDAAGTFTLSVLGQTSGSFGASVAPIDIATWLNTAMGTTGTQVTGTVQSGMVITWRPGGIIPTVGVLDHGAGPVVVDAVQGVINTLSPQSGVYPFSDVALSNIYGGTTFTFGGQAALSGQASTAAVPVPLITVLQSTCKAGAAYTNISIANTVQGAPAQGLGSATAQLTGPQAVPTGTLINIQTPQVGWTGVTNQIDCVSGTNIESDTEALIRRSNLLAAQAQGPLNAIVQRVAELTDVKSALAFQNTTGAANQVISFGGVPTTGSFVLALMGQTTAPILAQDTSQDVQTKLRALQGFADIQVTGSFQYGFTIDFAGANGGQAIALMVVADNQTNQNIQVDFGRPPKSIEIVVDGGSDTEVAQAILQAAPAGIATYSTPVLRTLATTAQGSANLAVSDTTGLLAGMSIECYGVTPGTRIASINGSTVAMTAPALAAYGNVRASFAHNVPLADSNNNTVLVGFSRPQILIVYVNVSVTTDTYITPGVPTSGINAAAQWNPAYAQTIQNSLVEIGNNLPIAGRIVAMGTNGLVGAFNSIKGIVDYSLTFGTTPNPTQTQNIQLLPAQAALFEAVNVAVSFV